MYQLIIWDPNYEKISRNRRSFINKIIDDTAVRKEEMGRIMDGRNAWKNGWPKIFISERPDK